MWLAIMRGCRVDAHRLQEEANKHRAAAAAAAQDASAVKRARFQPSIDDAQLARFQAALGDGLRFGRVGRLDLACLTPDDTTMENFCDHRDCLSAALTTALQ